MFSPSASYFSILRIDHPIVAREFSNLPFVDSISLTYPSSSNESKVLAAFYETVDLIKTLSGVTTARIANAMHFTYDIEAEEIDPCVVERQLIFYNDKKIGSIVVVASGILYSVSGTIQ